MDPNTFDERDASAIYGADLYRYAFTVWAEKVDGIDLSDEALAPIEARCRELLPEVKKAYTKKTGRSLVTPMRVTRDWKSTKPDFVVLKPDGWVPPRYGEEDEHITPASLGKHAEAVVLVGLVADTSRWATPAPAATSVRSVNPPVPLKWVIRAVWAMALTNVRAAEIIGVFTKEDRLGIYPLVWDQMQEKVIVAACEQFWNNQVRMRIPPPPDGNPKTRAYLTRLFPTSSGTLRPADLQVTSTATELRMLRKDGGDPTRITQLENSLCGTIGNDEGIADLCTWSHSTTTDWKNVIASLVTSGRITQAEVDALVDTFSTTTRAFKLLGEE